MITPTSEAVVKIVTSLFKDYPSKFNDEKYNKVIAYLTEGITLNECFGVHTKAIVSYILNASKKECINNGAMPTDTEILKYLTPDFCIEKAYECCLSIENSHEETDSLGISR